MMELVREWLLRMVGAALLTAAVSALTPKGAVRRVALLCCAVILLLAVLCPLTGESLPALPQFSSLGKAVERQKEEYQQSNLRAWESLIEEELISYIEAKAAELHCPCAVALRLGTDEEGLPFPEEVTLTAEEENDALTQLLMEELGLARERIRWRIEEA